MFNKPSLTNQLNNFTGDVATQRLEAGVRFGGPHVGNLAGEHGVEDLLQLGVHHHQPLDGFAE